MPTGQWTPSELQFAFHGVRVAVVCADLEVCKRVADDFAYFRVDPPDGRGAEACDLRLTAYRRAPAYDDLPPLVATIYSPRNVSYSNGDVTYIDYFGRALSIYRRRLQQLEVYATDVHLLHEILYGTILSRVAERLERRGLHRVHALAVEANAESALFLMPSGGGKTTLALEFLRRKDRYKLVSEDSPLIDAAGRTVPFPLRIGVRAESADAPPPFPTEYVTYIERMEFEPKFLISLAAFDGALATARSTPRWLFIGKRTLAQGCCIRPASKAAGFRALLEGMVVGVGLYQGVEFLLRTSVFDLWRLGGIILSRFRRAGTLLRRCEIFVVELGQAPERNANALIAFLEQQRFGGGPTPAPSAR
ncbi:MAG: hypothetical protein U0587_03505 [Candidatus Binatia bacterium]